MNNFPQFEISLSDFDYFSFGKNATFFLDIQEKEVKQLQQKLLNLFPHCDDLNKKGQDGQFHPHLTLGQCQTVITYRNNFMNKLLEQCEELYKRNKETVETINIFSIVCLYYFKNKRHPICCETQN